MLDGRTASDGTTCLLCSDALDFFEREQVVLKCLRSVFNEVLVEAMVYETLVRCPSESGGGVLGTDGVLGRDNVETLMLSLAIPARISAERRELMSYGAENTELSEERRFWNRYMKEAESAAKGDEMEE